MFRARCAAEGRDVLLSPRRITAIRTGPAAVEIDFTCWCGTPGTVVEHRPGRPSTPDEAAPRQTAGGLAATGPQPDPDRDVRTAPCRAAAA